MNNTRVEGGDGKWHTYGLHAMTRYWAITCYFITKAFRFLLVKSEITGSMMTYILLHRINMIWPLPTEMETYRQGTAMISPCCRVQRRRKSRKSRTLPERRWPQCWARWKWPCPEVVPVTNLNKPTQYMMIWCSSFTIQQRPPSPKLL